MSEPKQGSEESALKRMNDAARGGIEVPPRKPKDEPKRRKNRSSGKHAD